MKYIELTQNKKAIVDDEDFERLSQYKWCFNTQGYAVCVKYAGRVNKKTVNNNLRMHRLVMSAKAGIEVDHINGNRLDNRKINLRFATHTENAYNRRAMPNNKSGYKGVSKHSSPWNLKNPWRASIVVDRRRMHLGFYSTPELASEAYKKAALKYHGEFACVS